MHVHACAELVAGARSARQQAAVRQALEAKGQPSGTADCLIAGIVLAHDGILLTRNRRYCKRIEGLAVSPVYE